MTKGKLGRLERSFLAESGIEPGTQKAAAALASYRDTYEYKVAELEVEINRLAIPFRLIVLRQLRRQQKLMRAMQEEMIKVFYGER